MAVCLLAVMNILLLSSRFPWPPFTGDPLRAAIWLSALEDHANVALVSPARTLPPGFRVLDAIDSLRRSMEERSREGSLLARPLWRAEARRVARAERDAARAYDRVVVVSDEDSAELGAVAISNGVTIAPLADAPRTFDFAFWGRLPYFANDDAAAWLLAEIWPAIRAARPSAP